MKLFPRFMVKILPFLLVILGYLNIRRYKNKFLYQIPYLMGSGIILTIYPTLAYDYSVPCVFCFILLVIYWEKCSNVNGNFRNFLVKYLFFLFIIIASFSVFVSEFIVIYGYILFSIIFILLSLLDLSVKSEESKFNALVNWKTILWLNVLIWFCGIDCAGE